MIVNELILKVSSICNLNCRYCYVFNQGDTSYQKEPSIMSMEVGEQVINAIKEHCEKNKMKEFLIIFHGGEPLLAGKDFYRQFIKSIKTVATGIDVRFALQTNGTLLTKEWLCLFDKLNIAPGISIDGTRKASINRVFRSNNRCAYDSIIKGIHLLQKNDYSVNVLSVINTDEKTETIYEHLKEQKVSYADFLLPDKTFDKKTDDDYKIGEWLISLFNIWYNDSTPDKPVIRMFDVIIGLILGVERGNEVFGRKFNQCICVKPNGDIQAVDNLMVCGDGFTKTGYNVKHNNFDEALETYVIKTYYNAHQDSILCEKCRNCIIKNICGGGHIAHRFSKSNGFNNPTVYCRALFSLIVHVQNIVADEMNKTCGLSLEKIEMSCLRDS